MYEMQVRAIARAALAVRQRTGRGPRLEIMIRASPTSAQLELVRVRVVSVAEEEGRSYRAPTSASGQSIELPRACFVAESIAGAMPTSFVGTNDLTQCGIGFSRDDIEGRIYLAMSRKIVNGSPFATIDEEGVGELRANRRRAGTRERPDLELWRSR